MQQRALAEQQRVARVHRDDVGIARAVECREFATEFVAEVRKTGPQRQALVADGHLVGGKHCLCASRIGSPQVAEIADAQRAVELQRGDGPALAGVPAAEVVDA